MVNTSKIDATTLAAVIALGGVLISASVAFVTANRSVYVNAVTAARIRWIEKIRDLVIQFREIHLKMAMENKIKRKVEHNDNYTISRLTETLRLSLGRSVNEQNILRLALHCGYTIEDYDETVRYSDLLREHSRWLLETEWRRIKYEASNVVVHSFYKSKMWKRQREYNNFAAGEGAYVDLREALASGQEIVRSGETAPPASAVLP